ncbi:MAG: cobalamin biosynthesis protein CobW [Synechococcus sp. SB0673_bin_10]|nr:cobalamin biosynthesis protein CobW [Synechococcus sp. SB0667_bin_8]MXY63429.1 cobalamin biosynthesis protein CobW [Synechococcus sp. SB0665_bin_28]MYF19278.1 cobalamin biosynthesis protein CobW [Synechococcus sp. SB0677_bin_5]MYG64648.1 cobalamin biosynthesis protein CobW [Synechococcus sp. SB0675_bin_7]MYI72372.1 cobalamin biosynthesis protein CobW [Synechococcus sp. SB0673_bin_10]MYK84931.1 cobalamin biosynthesis protein CobW [Synechococcus sp. SB0669_bin_7]
MTTTAKLPVTIVTGFLGAGKTTVLRHVLTQQKRRLAVLVNEFGDVGLDGAALADCGVCGPESSTAGTSSAAAGAQRPTVVELANGCLCCTVQEEFLPVMLELLERRQNLDGIIIETSGLALPQPLLDAFRWPGIRTAVTVDSVVTMVDGEALAAGSVVGDAAAVERQRQADPELEHLTSLETLLADQLHSADLVLVSRADKISAAEMAAVKARIHPHMRPGVPVLASHHGAVPPELLLGLDRDVEGDPGRTSPHHPAGHGDHHDHPHDHHHAPVTSAVVKLEGVWDRQALEALLRQQFTAMGLLRAKGYAAIAGKSLPLMIQAVGPRLETWYQARSDNRGGLTMVLIGLAVDPSPLHTALADLRLRSARSSVPVP